MEKARLHRIKNDPLKRAEQQEKEKLKYLKKKALGKVKAAKDMTPNELRKARKRWREYGAAYRKRKQNVVEERTQTQQGLENLENRLDRLKYKKTETNVE